MKYHIGKNKTGAILNEDGLEIALFEKGYEDLAEKFCYWLSPEIDIDIGDIWSIPYLGTELFEVIGVDRIFNKATFKRCGLSIYRTLTFEQIKKTCAFVRPKRKYWFF